MSKFASTQNYLPISGIRNDTIVLKDGTLRAAVLCSSVNFSLKSEKEQKSIIAGYIGFINSLEWPIQIVIQSRKLNIDSYLEKLKNLEMEQTNDLLRIQMRDYASYVKELVQIGEIMTKKFFIVIPYNPLGDLKRKFIDRFVEIFKAPSFIKMKREKFEKYRSELFKRVDHVISGLAGIGVNVMPLDTQSLIELFYNSYNPTESQSQKLESVEKIRLEG
ncbi:MAG: hypothetical protein KGZ85_05395 [Ignavibacterium sp.]|nr:hypothetical protein [Ignavibacterium sp.]